MQPISEFKNSKIQFVFTDIDDTLTSKGLLQSEAYAAMWQLHKSGIKIIPVTGRPAGWCELIARQWPVMAVVGENGGFYFCLENKKMLRRMAVNEDVQIANQKKLMQIRDEILKEVPGSAVASDQFCRMFDLAIDFCEDVPQLKSEDVQKIVSIFQKHGATAKVSSIHVNGWFGHYDKLFMCKLLAKDILGKELADLQDEIAFVGDSPNDEPMFDFFENALAVANIKDFEMILKSKPKFIANERGGLGFAQIAQRILELKK